MPQALSPDSVVDTISSGTIKLILLSFHLQTWSNASSQSLPSSSLRMFLPIRQRIGQTYEVQLKLMGEMLVPMLH